MKESIWSVGGNDTNRGKSAYPEDTSPYNTLTTTVTIWTGLVSKSYLRRDRLAITCVTHITARIYLDPY
jgi:hypothetical protein